MDFSVLRSVVFGALDGLQRASETVVSRVFTSAFVIIMTAQGTAHGAVDITFSLARSVLRTVERATAEVLGLVFGVARAIITVAVGRPLTKVAGAEEEIIDAQV